MTQGTASKHLGRRSSQLRLLLVATIAAGMVVAVGFAGPAGAAAGDDEALRALCRQVADRPAQGGAELTTDPRQGAPLEAGQTVNLTMRWEPADFDGVDLERVAHCVVTLDGKLRLDLSGAETPSANDGEYRGSFVMPAELAPGDCLCVLGVVDGESGGRPLRVGAKPCLTVTKPAPPAPPNPPTTSVTSQDRRETTVLPSRETAPPALVPASQTAPIPLAELPRTGPAGPRLLLAMAGLALVLGGGAITTRRRGDGDPTA